MEFAFSGKRVAGVGTVALIAAAMACSDTPVEPGLRSAPPEPVFDQTTKDDGLKKPSLHYARVRSDGVLVDGTAISATKLSTGSYRVTFPPPIGGCAASANSAAFQGFDQSVFRIMVQISIGTGPGGVFDDESVAVTLFESTGTSQDSSFSLILVCP